MGSFLLYLLRILVITIIVLFTYNIVKTYVLNSIKVNKWAILGMGIFFLVLQTAAVAAESGVFVFITQILFLFSFLWFMDEMGWTDKFAGNVVKDGEPKKKRPNATRVKHKKNKKDVIKPKAKPNRAKK